LYPVCIIANEANQSTNIDTARKQFLFHDGAMEGNELITGIQASIILE
jgi:hypothetical protein